MDTPCKNCEFRQWDCHHSGKCGEYGKYLEQQEVKKAAKAEKLNKELYGYIKDKTKGVPSKWRM